MKTSYVNDRKARSLKWLILIVVFLLGMFFFLTFPELSKIDSRALFEWIASTLSVLAIITFIGPVLVYFIWCRPLFKEDDASHNKQDESEVLPPIEP